MNGHRISILGAGLVLLAVVAAPERRPDDIGRGLPGFDAAPRLAGFLTGTATIGAPFDGERSDLGDQLALDPVGGADLLEERLSGLRFGGDAILPRVDATLRMWWPHRALPPVDVPFDVRDLPLRAPPLLGDRGLDLLRTSARNVDVLPSDTLAALAELVEAVRFVAGSDPVDAEAAALALRCLVETLDRVLPVLRRARTRGHFERLTPLPDGAGIPRGLLLVSETDAGMIVIGGPGPTVIPMQGVALAIDVGGDDRWLANVAMGDDPNAAVPPPVVRVVIDLDGRDRYVGDGRTFASAIGGVSVLVDEAGDDFYESEAPAFAVAVDGAALLVDRAGRDRYRVVDGGLGSARRGFALMMDDAGDDRYETRGTGLGAAEQSGFAGFLDTWGNDIYLALGALPDPGATPILALGVATDGGLGLFVDRDGRDVYRAASRAGGFADTAGVAVFMDGGGDDLLSFGTDALGSAGTGGFALFRDLTGDDRVLSRARSQGFADAGLAFHVDDAGDDDRRSQRPSVGVGERGGTAIFVDLEGR